MSKRSRALAVGLTSLMFVVACFSASALASDTPERVIGLGVIAYGTVHTDDAGNIAKITGFNLGLGYSARFYRSEGGLQADRFNGYWGWGTVALIIPYVEFGASYAFEVGKNNQLITIDLGLLYIVPYFGFSVYF